MKNPIDNNFQMSLPFDAVEGVATQPVSIEKRPVRQKKSKKNGIDDFGEKIGGARKDLAAVYKAIMDKITDDTLAKKPLSQIFPRPDVARLVKEGNLSRANALSLKYLYDLIPTKPRQYYKQANWVQKVRKVVNLTNEIITYNPDIDFMQNCIDTFKKSGDLDEVSKCETYIALGVALNFPDVDFNMRNYRVVQLYKETDYSIVQDHLIIGKFKTFDKALDELKERVTRTEIIRSKVALAIYRDRKTQEIYIAKTIQGKNPIKLKGDFLSGQEARVYLSEHRSELEDLWHKINISPQERPTSNRPRIGEDNRHGKDVTPDMFTETFGFRGVEFGNWVNGEERQAALNESFVALMDLAKVIGKSPRSLSLNGELALAFGARGGISSNIKSPSAHYERVKVVINLTKTRGAGSLAHEWFHALDNYFSRQRGDSDNYLTEKPHVKLYSNGKEDPTRKELIETWHELIMSVRNSDIAKRSSKLDSSRSKDYWSLPIEIGARVFENYVIEKLSEYGIQNDYLANFKELGEWVESSNFDMNSYPYPKEDESPLFNEKFDQLFSTIQERIDKDTKQSLLFKEDTFFSNAENAVLKIEQQKATAEQWLKMIDKSGGLKAGEDKWMGLSEWLNEDPNKILTKGEVIEFINTNKIEVAEVLLENGNVELEWEPGYSEIFNYYQTTHGDETYTISLEHQDRNEIEIYDFDGIQLAVKKDLDNAKDFVHDLCSKQDVTKNIEWTTPGLENMKVIALTTPAIKSWELEDATHYGDIGDGKTIAWVRFGEITDQDGRRILLLDEIQSSRHQQGRKFGYRTEQIDAEFQANMATYNTFVNEMSQKYNRIIAGSKNSALSKDESTHMEALYKTMNIEGWAELPPSAPFEKNWHELAFKRMLRYATDNDYDVVAWTTGEQQSQRYDLKVGTQGMSGFYDKILVNFANKCGKKWDVDVQSVQLPIGDKGESVVHSLTITPVMRESVLQGQPMFKELDPTELKQTAELRGEISSRIAEMSEKLHVPVNLVSKTENLPSNIVKAINLRRILHKHQPVRCPGVYDPQTGLVYFVLENIHSIEEAEKFFLHEVIAHKGIDGLLGKEKANVFYVRVFDSLDKTTQTQLLAKYKDKTVAGAEYVALVAEDNKGASMVNKVISIFKEVLSSVGITLRVKNEDIRVMLAQSRKYLRKQQKGENVTQKLPENKKSKPKFRLKI